MKRQNLHFLIFHAMGGAIAVAAYMAFGAMIRRGSMGSWIMDISFFLFPLLLLLIMFLTCKPEARLSYRQKAIPSATLIILILLIIVALNIYNIHGRDMDLDDIWTGLKNISVFGLVQLILAALIALTPVPITPPK